jgi:hypothetical protein
LNVVAASPKSPTRFSIGVPSVDSTSRSCTNSFSARVRVSRIDSKSVHSLSNCSCSSAVNDRFSLRASSSS